MVILLNKNPQLQKHRSFKYLSSPQVCLPVSYRNAMFYKLYQKVAQQTIQIQSSVMGQHLA